MRPVAYGVGFMAATALLHLTGLGGGLLLGMARHGRAAMRTAGGLAAVAGLGILAGVV